MYRVNSMDRTYEFAVVTCATAMVVLLEGGWILVLGDRAIAGLDHKEEREENYYY